MADVPLPEPDMQLVVHGQAFKIHSIKAIRAHAAAVTAAARDCRTCRFVVRDLPPTYKCGIGDGPCISGSLHEPLTPVRLWRTT